MKNIEQMKNIKNPLVIAGIIIIALFLIGTCGVVALIKIFL